MIFKKLMAIAVKKIRFGLPKMRKSLYFLFSLLAFPLFPAPVGNPSAPALMKEGLFTLKSNCYLRSGYQGNFTFDHRLKQYDQGAGRTDNFEVYSNDAIITINLVNRWDIYSTLGNGKIHSNWRVTTPSSQSRVVCRSNYKFIWAVGTNIQLLNWGKTSLGVGGKYTEFNPSLRSISIDGESMNAKRGRYTFNEWQVNLGFSHKVAFLIPYIGVKYSCVSGHLNAPYALGIASDGGSQNSFDSRDHFGLYLGASITSGDYVMVNLETRLIDEEAVAILADLRF